MGMNLGTGGSDEPQEMVDINTTPLIDVMLVLLIMLIITIPIQTHAVKMTSSCRIERHWSSNCAKWQIYRPNRRCICVRTSSSPIVRSPQSWPRHNDLV